MYFFSSLYARGAVRRLREKFLDVSDVLDVSGVFGRFSSVYGHLGSFLDVLGPKKYHSTRVP